MDQRVFQHGGGSMGGRSRSQQKDKQPRKVISVSIQQDVKLHTVENAWKPGNKSEKETEDPDTSLTNVRVCFVPLCNPFL